MKIVNIGYWKSSFEPQYPLPEENSASSEDLIQFEDIWQKIEKKSLKLQYKGWSTCRLCKCSNGSTEYEIRIKNIKFRIPEGYAHYIRIHNVKPDLEKLNKIVPNLKEKEDLVQKDRHPIYEYFPKRVVHSR